MAWRAASSFVFYLCLVLGQQDDEIPYLLKVIDLGPNIGINSIELQCFEKSRGDSLPGAIFWLGDTPLAEQTTVRSQPRGNILFVITPDLEGMFSCGLQIDPINRVESEPLRLVAFPEPQVMTSPNTTHRVVSGTTAHLPCSIKPGILVELYIVQWLTVNRETLVEFRWGATRINEDPEKYSVDPSDLSLLISNVAAGDAGGYVCVLGVNGPDRENRDMFYDQTRLVNITLTVFDLPEIEQPPTPQVVALADNAHNYVGGSTTFGCTASAPTSFDIVWLHNGVVIRPSESNRFRVTPTGSSTNGGITQTSSQLEINDIRISDSGSVICEARIPASEALNNPESAAKNAGTTLTVLGGFQNIKSSITQEGHVLFDIRLHNTIPTEVRLLVEYTPVNGNANKNITTREGFINTENILYLERQPPPAVRDTEFTVRVTFTTPDFAIEGPFSEQSQVLDVRARPMSIEEVITIATAASVSALVLIICIFLAAIIIPVIVAKYCKKRDDKHLAANIGLEHFKPKDSNPEAAAKELSKVILVLYKTFKQCDSEGKNAKEVTFTDEQIRDAVEQIEEVVRAGVKHSQMSAKVIEKMKNVVNVIQEQDKGFLIDAFKKCRCYADTVYIDSGEIIRLRDENEEAILADFVQFMKDSLICVLQKEPDLRDQFKVIINQPQ